MPDDTTVTRAAQRAFRYPQWPMAVMRSCRAQAQERLLWLPVAMAVGIALYFTGSFALAAQYRVWIALLCAGCLGIALLLRGWGALGAAFVGLVLGGYALAQARTQMMQAPILGWAYYGPIEGRVVIMDRSASEALRVTLDQVTMPPISPERTPQLIRLSLHGPAQDGRQKPLQIGDLIRVEARFLPPSSAAEPGGFDFQRHAYFLGLGAVGYTRQNHMVTGHDPSGLWLTRTRMHLSRAIQDRMAAGAGGFAAAILTGDRAGLQPADVEAMRDTNIAHLIAISGLHMGLLTGFVFTALRVLLALYPPVALRYPTKKWAAAAALTAGGFYLALSGGSVATERAYIQVAVMFVAVLCDRRAISLRSVAIAAMLVLIRRPETLLSPGFQMSFAATAALVVGFGAMTDLMRDRPPARHPWLRRLLLAGFGIVASSILAGLATAPFAAWHFNRLTTYGLLANLVAMPIMGSLVMPLGVVAAVLAPLGLAELALFPMEQGLSVILAVAHELAQWPRAVRMVVTPPAPVMPIFALGFVGVLIWQGWGRLVFLAPILFALLLWSFGTRPDVLIAPSGRVVGALDERGHRALSHARGEGFVVRMWLENDGDAADQEAAATRPLWRVDGVGQVAQVRGRSIWHGRGKGARDAARAACLVHDVVIVVDQGGEDDRDQPVQRRDQAPPLSCLYFDAGFLRITGAVALYMPPDPWSDIHVHTQRDWQGIRPWSGRVSGRISGRVRP